ncbi:MAG: hypothetical protein OEW42_00995 [Acidimicrobiia bacterium]|nr:hypothetical protein [Acidimicrobiia bacterium]MDH5236264.1 hypothetical protein [Acidimicrobiia bacterium]
MENLSGLIALSVRCSGADRDQWRAWMGERHLPGLGALSGVRAVTWLEVVPAPTLGAPGLGFSHVELVELTEPLDAAVASVRAHLVSERLGAAGRDDHAIVNGEVLVPHGPHGAKAPVTPALSGHILANVLCTDHRREADWDRWYDDDHLPDMMASGAFTGASRWRRRLRPQWGAAHVTLYDIDMPVVTDAVERSAAVMPDLVARGRKHPCHCGGLTLALQRADR